MKTKIFMILAAAFLSIGAHSNNAVAADKPLSPGGGTYPPGTGVGMPVLVKGIKIKH